MIQPPKTSEAQEPLNFLKNKGSLSCALGDTFNIIILHLNIQCNHIWNLWREQIIFMSLTSYSR